MFDADVRLYRFYLLTLTAPSFGRVHRVPRSASGVRKRCGCGATHDALDAGLRGTPLDPGAYDYAGQVAWNRDAGVLWDRTRRRLRDWWPSVELFLVREWQDRGVLHLRGLVRIHRSEAPAPALLRETSRTVEAFGVDGSAVRWGDQVDAQSFRADGDGDGAKTIWYLSKALNYMIKDTALAAMDGRGSSPGDPMLARAHSRRVCKSSACALRVALACGQRYASHQNPLGLVVHGSDPWIPATDAGCLGGVSGGSRERGGARAGARAPEPRVNR